MWFSRRYHVRYTLVCDKYIDLILSNKRWVTVEYAAAGDRARLKVHPRLLYRDVIESMLQEIKVRNLNVSHFCAIRQMSLNEAKYESQNKNELDLFLNVYYYLTINFLYVSSNYNFLLQFGKCAVVCMDVHKFKIEYLIP